MSGEPQAYFREHLFATIVCAGIGLALLIRWLRALWARLAPPPNPWGTEIDAALAQPDATPVCHRCFTPQPALPGWFCPACGGATGPYNNWMSYLWIFSLGEVLRTGAFRRFPVTRLTVTGFVLVSLVQYHVFAPVYWFWLARNVHRLHQTTVPQPGTSNLEPDP